MGQLVMKQAIEIGFFDIPFYFESPLCIAFWCIFLFSMVIQILILKKAKRTVTKYIYILLLVLFMAVCEIWYQFARDWDFLLPLFGYMIFFTLAAGAVISAAIYYIYNKIKNSC